MRRQVTGLKMLNYLYTLAILKSWVPSKLDYIRDL